MASYPATVAAALPPARELLHLAGIYEPPVRIAPILDALGIPWRQDNNIFLPRCDGETVYVPGGRRARHPGMNVSIAHEIAHAILRIPGGMYDVADRPALRVRENEFDAYARELVMPESWFRDDAHRLRGRGAAEALAERYSVPTTDPRTGVITRAIELDLAHVVCRDAESYRLYLKHPYWSGQEWMGGPGRRIAYLTTHRYCEHDRCRNRATVVHHLPVGYKFLGAERDEHLRAVCKPHHDAQHRNAELTLF